MSSTPKSPAAAGSRGNGIPRVIVATTALLTFISFWRAAAIVLNDLASSAYYAGGEAEGYIGKTAPWFILAIMLFSYAVRAVYVESCSMFVRGGVYRAVKMSLGGTLAKFSVSALMFDYILTGPISGVAAGQYLAGLINDLLQYFHVSGPLSAGSVDFIAASFAIVVTLYFWWQNTKGVAESSEKALHIMKLVTVMVVLLIAWCIYTVAVRHSALPPLPHPRNLRLSASALGWLAHSSLPHMFGIIAIFIALGHSVLAMSGEESLAQVYREIESPKLPNLKKAGLVIFIYSLVFTSLVSFFAVMIIPDDVRQHFLENLIGWRTRDESRRALNRPSDFSRLRRCGRNLYSGGRCEHRNRWLERCAEPRFRRRSAQRLVPPATPALRHKLSHHQYRRGATDHHHHHQPR